MSNLIAVLDYVLPEGCVLYKSNHGSWEYFKDDRDFEDGRVHVSQRSAEIFDVFIKRLLDQLIKEEVDSNDPDPTVQIDNAIYNKDYYKPKTAIIGEGAESESEL